MVRNESEIIEAFGAAGVTVREDAVSAEEYDRRSLACDADLFFSGWICATGDAGELFEGNFYSKGSRGNACGYGSDELDAAGEEDDVVVVGVDGCGDEVMLVDVEADEASG